MAKQLKPYVCKYCERTFYELDELRNHKDKTGHVTTIPTQVVNQPTITT